MQPNGLFLSKHSFMQTIKFVQAHSAICKSDNRLSATKLLLDMSKCEIWSELKKA